MQAVEPRITADVFGVLGVEQSVRSRTSYGGTAPANVRDAARGGSIAFGARHRTATRPTAMPPLSSRILNAMPLWCAAFRSFP